MKLLLRSLAENPLHTFAALTAPILGYNVAEAYRAAPASVSTIRSAA